MVKGAQDGHIEAGQYGVEIIVIKDGIAKIIEVVDRSQRLGQFLCRQSLISWADGRGNENRHPCATRDLRPVQSIA